MRKDIVTVKRPESEEDCKSMRKCWRCAIYIDAVQGNDFFDCFDTEKMKSNVEELFNCF